MGTKSMGVQVMGSGLEDPEPANSFRLDSWNRRLGENGQLAGKGFHKFNQIR
jgi:hypothetical protein